MTSHRANTQRSERPLRFPVMQMLLKLQRTTPPPETLMPTRSSGAHPGLDARPPHLASERPDLNTPQARFRQTMVLCAWLRPPLKGFGGRWQRVRKKRARRHRAHSDELKPAARR